jgi:predicted restriction endonuclease
LWHPIDTAYRVKASAGLIGHHGHPYNLKKFNGQPIHLLADRRYYHDPLNLEWHGGNLFKG